MSGDEPDSKETYELSAVFDADSFFYGIWDKEMHLQRADYLNNWPENPDVIWPGLGAARFGLANHLFALVPETEFVQEEQKHYVLDTCRFDNKRSYIFRNDYAEKFHLRVVYALGAPDLKRLNSHFETPALVHIVTSYLDSLQTLTFDSKIHVMLLSSKMLVVVSNAEKLQLVNLYKVNSSNDILYFISLLCNRFELDPVRICIELSGFINPHTENYSQLQKYFGNLRFRKITDLSQIENNHCYHALHSVSKCA